MSRGHGPARPSTRRRSRRRHGIGLGFMSFFVKATVDALKTVPEVNAYIDGDEIVTNHYYDIGIAVSTDQGLVVPVIRDADRLTMAEIEASIADLAGARRSDASSSPISPARSSRSPTAASSARCCRPRSSTRRGAPSSACTRSRNARSWSTTRS